MKYFVALIIVAVIFLAIKRLYEKTNLHNKIVGHIKHYPYSKLILGLLLIVWTISIEILIYFLNEKFKQNYGSLILRAIFVATVYEFVPFLFEKKQRETADKPNG